MCGGFRGLFDCLYVVKMSRGPVFSFLGEGRSVFFRKWIY